jgi:hypothetical protein
MHDDVETNVERSAGSSTRTLSSTMPRPDGISDKSADDETKEHSRRGSRSNVQTMSPTTRRISLAHLAREDVSDATPRSDLMTEQPDRLSRPNAGWGENLATKL